ncbi:MAG TPA: hypothetical protein VGL10_00535, partial [Gammaproteobacteria bacterium]
EYAGAAGMAHKAVSFFILAVFSMIGWRLSMQVGYELGGPVPFVNAGALGGLVLTLGLLFAWRIRAGAWKFAGIATATGTVGGLVFHFIDQYFIGALQNDDIWILFLFAEWQTIFMMGVAIALNYGRSK